MNIKIPIENNIVVVPVDVYIKVRVSPMLYGHQPEQMLIDQALARIEHSLQCEVQKAIDFVLEEHKLTKE